MQSVRGKAAALTLLMLTTTFGTVAMPGHGGADDPHAPIEIGSDQELRQNACACVRNPSASGTASDPYIISDWRVNSASGEGITIKNIRTEHFIVRDNTVDAETAIQLINTGDRGKVIGNTVNYKDIGIRLFNTAAEVEDNTIDGTWNTFGWIGGKGILVNGGSPQIQGNQLTDGVVGIKALSSSPTILENDLVSNRDAVLLSKAAQATLRDNAVNLSARWGLIVADSSSARLIGNTIQGGQGGIIADSAAGLYLEGNNISNQQTDAVRFTNTQVTMFRNTISNNWRGAVGSQSSDLLIKDNIFRNNGGGLSNVHGDAIRLADTKGSLIGNEIRRNQGTGISIKHSILELKDNRLYNNTFGFSIPYDSKQTIDRMSGNIVNGVNVDGTDDPSEKRLFYKRVGIEITNQTVDSGFHEGFYGVLTKQGAVVLYDVADVLIQNVTFSYNVVADDSLGEGRAIKVQSGFNVRIRGNVFINNEQGVLSVDSRTFIKDNECDIDVDPPNTVCFHAKGGYVTVRSNIIAHLAVGVRYGLHNGVPAGGVISDNEIRATTRAGIWLRSTSAQAEHALRAEFNTMEENSVGMLLVDFHGRVEGNVIGNSTWAAVQLKDRTNATFEGNVIVENEKGIVDTEPCSSNYRTPCSSGVFVDNRIKANTKIGVRLHNGGSFQGDVVTGNEIGLKLGGSTVLEDVTVSANGRAGIEAEGHIGLRNATIQHNGRVGLNVEGTVRADETNASYNEEDGIRVRGRAHLEASAAVGNEDDGIDIRGSARIQGGDFSNNTQAGMRLAGTIFYVTECEVSYNHDGAIMADAMVEVDTDLDLTIDPPPIPSVDDLTDDDEEQDPLFMHDCNVVANQEYAVKASANTIVNATNNFWGKAGPKIDMPVASGDNVISAHVLATPYYKSRAHDTTCVVPSTEIGSPGEETRACLEFS